MPLRFIPNKYKMSNETQLLVKFAQNQTFYMPYRLDLSKSGIKTVGDLRKAVSRRFYLQPHAITIKYRQYILEDNQTPISNINLEHKNEVTVLVHEPAQIPIPNAKPLIIGGIDFTNTKQIQQLFNIKKQQKKPEPIPARSNNNRQEEKGEIDYKQKYKNELTQLKSQLEAMGMDNDENTLLLRLINYNGNIQRVINALFE